MALQLPEEPTADSRVIEDLVLGTAGGDLVDLGSLLYLTEEGTILVLLFVHLLIVCSTYSEVAAKP